MATAADVLANRERWAVEQADALEWLRSLPERCASLVLFSPPYEAQRTYGVGFKLRGQAWVDWMRRVVVAAARVSNGLVVVNAACPVEGHRFSTSLEWLVADLTRHDGLVCGPSPYAWVKNGQPGSGSAHYHRRNFELLYGFCYPDRLPLAYSNNLAFGKPPVCKPGGPMSNRKRNGERVATVGVTRRQNGVKGRAGEASAVRRPPPAIANPGNVIRATVGKGQMGHAAAHENEAPMPVKVAERFVCWYAPPGGVVLDPFSGSGTTCHAAVMHGRRFVGCDLRQSQVDLCARRMATVTPELFSGAV